MTDHCVGQIRLIFQPILSSRERQPYLTYAQRMDPKSAPATADPVSGLFRLKRAFTTSPDKKRIGAVVEASRIRTAIAVEPLFGANSVDPAITGRISAEVFTLFNLNTYADKDLFELLHVRTSST